MTIKQATVFTFEGKASFNEEFILDNQVRDLHENEVSLVRFTPLFDDTFVQQVGRFLVARISLQERKPVDDTVLHKKTLEALPEDYTEDEYDTKAEDVRMELYQTSGFKNEKNPLVIIDNETKTLVVTESAKVTDEVMHLVLSSLQGEYDDVKLVSFEAPIIEKLLTEFLLDDVRNIPDPFMLGEKVTLGTKSEFDKSPKSATITIKKEYPADTETLAFIQRRNKVAKLIQLEYDGVCEFDFTNKFEIKAIKFKEGLDYKADPDAADSLNFMSQFVLQLPTLFDIITSLTKQVEGVEY